jgi:hypothetical protein
MLAIALTNVHFLPFLKFKRSSHFLFIIELQNTVIPYLYKTLFRSFYEI